MSADAERIATLAEELKAAYAGLNLAVVTLADPRLPLWPVWRDVYEMTPDAPLIIRRQDGTQHSGERVYDVLARAAAIPGGGLRGDLLSFVCMHGATRIGDQIKEAGLRDKDNPLLEFVRHFRNACAHGNRWHFTNNEPRYPAALRGRAVTAAMHGSRAAPDWVGPGDYLDMLDDLITHFRGLA
jgi:hypothetical protein